MRLKHQQQPAGKRMHGFERGRYLVGVMGKIVYHRHAIDSAHNLQPPPDAAEFTQIERGIRQRHAASLRGAERGERVGNIMQSWNLQFHLDGLAGVARLDAEGNAGR